MHVSSCHVLPHELYRPILEHIDDVSTLLALLLSSRSLNREAERILYHTVNLSVLYSSAAADISFFDRVVACPRVARHVRVVSIFQRQQEFDERYQSRMVAGLRATVNLKYLAIKMPVNIVRLLADCTFQLLELHCPFYSGSIDEFYEDEFVNFFSRQPLLEQLEIQYRLKPSPLPLSVCPSLSVLTGDTPTVAAFLPGRNIQCLRWRIFEQPFLNDDGDHEASSHFVNNIAESLQRLRALSLMDFHRRLSLSQIVEHLSSLRYLELKATVADVPVLQRLSNLRGLRIFGGGLYTALFPVKELFVRILSLQFVEVTSERPGVLRWERGHPIPHTVPGAFDNWCADLA